MAIARFRVAALTGAALFLLGACTGGGASPTPTATTAPATAPASAEASPSAAGSVAPSAPAIVVPDAIKTAGKLVWCVDVSYPPEESYQADGSTAEGSDIDIANEIGKRFGVSVEIDNTGFDGIIPALQAKKCDLIISGMNDTPGAGQGRRLRRLPQGRPGPPRRGRQPQGHQDARGPVGQGRRGPAGHDQQGRPRRCEQGPRRRRGKPKIDIQTFQKDTDAFQQLSLGRVDAYSGDSPVCAYYAAKSGGKFEVGGSPILPIPIGIAVNKSDTQLRDAVKAAIDGMYADGTLKSIVDKWGMTDAVELLQ